MNSKDAKTVIKDDKILQKDLFTSVDVLYKNEHF
jgi:hypothetical protein